MSAQSAWSRWAQFVCKVVGLLLAWAALVLCCAYLIVASWNSRGGSPTNIAVAPDGTIYVSDHGYYATTFNIAGKCVWVVDSRNDRVAGLIKIARGGNGIGVAPNGKVYIFPLSPPAEAPEVTVFDPRTSRVSQITVPPGGFTRISFAPDGRVLLLGTREWHIIDPTTDQYVGTTPMSAVPGVLYDYDAVTLDGQRAYTSYCRGSYWEYQFGVEVIDTRTETKMRDIPLPTLAVSIVPLPDGRFYALCNGPDGAYYVVVVDPQTGTILKTIPLGREPWGGYQDLGIPRSHRMVLAPNGKVYIVRGTYFVYGYKPAGEEQGIGLYVVDPATDTVVNFIPLEPPLDVRLFPFLSIEQAVTYLGQLGAIVASSLFRPK